MRGREGGEKQKTIEGVGGKEEGRSTCNSNASFLAILHLQIMVHCLFVVQTLYTAQYYRLVDNTVVLQYCNTVVFSTIIL